MNHFDLANSLYTLGRYKEADQRILQALQDEPNNAQVYALAALIKSNLLQTKRAHHFSAKAISLAPDWSYAYYVKSIICLQTSDHTDARKNIDEAIQLDPNDSDYQRFLSVIYAEQKRWPPAIRAARRALTIDPLSDRALYQMAYCLHARGKFNQARAFFKQVLERNPDHARAHYYLGKYAIEANDYESAAHHLSFSLQRNPADAEVQVAWQDTLTVKYWFYRYSACAYRAVRYGRGIVVYPIFLLLCVSIGLLAYLITRQPEYGWVYGFAVALLLPILHGINRLYMIFIGELILNWNRSTRRMLSLSQRMSFISMVLAFVLIILNVILAYSVNDKMILISVRMASVIVVMISASFACSCLIGGILWFFVLGLLWNLIEFWMKG